MASFSRVFQKLIFAKRTKNPRSSMLHSAATYCPEHVLIQENFAFMIVPNFDSLKLEQQFTLELKTKNNSKCHLSTKLTGFQKKLLKFTNCYSMLHHILIT